MPPLLAIDYFVKIKHDRCSAPNQVTHSSGTIELRLFCSLDSRPILANPIVSLIENRIFGYVSGVARKSSSS